MVNELFDWPSEIKSAFRAFQHERDFQIVALVIDCGDIPESEIIEKLDLSEDELSDSLRRLQNAGIVTRYTTVDYPDFQKGVISISEYGTRVVDNMFDTLGEGVLEFCKKRPDRYGDRIFS